MYYIILKKYDTLDVHWITLDDIGYEISNVETPKVIQIGNTKMRVINNNMIQPIKQKTSLNKNYTTITAYHKKYKIHTFKELMEFVYSHKHNYKPLIGEIQVKFNFETEKGIIMPYLPSWDINRKDKGKIDYLYKVTSYDQYQTKYQDKFTIAIPKRVPFTLGIKYRKKIYDEIWVLPLNETVYFEKGLYTLTSIEMWDIKTRLFELNEKYQKTLPLTIPNRKKKYWQPKGI